MFFAPMEATNVSVANAVAVPAKGMNLQTKEAAFALANHAPVVRTTDLKRSEPSRFASVKPTSYPYTLARSTIMLAQTPIVAPTTAPRFDLAWFIIPLLIGLWIPAGCGLRPQSDATHSTPAVFTFHPQGRAAASTDEQIIKRVRRVVIRQHLLPLPLAQVTFEIFRGDGPDACDVIVRENHEYGGGGDPNTAPRLFSVRVDQTTGALSTDAHALTTGEFQRLRD